MTKLQVVLLTLFLTQIAYAADADYEEIKALSVPYMESLAQPRDTLDYTKVNLRQAGCSLEVPKNWKPLLILDLDEPPYTGGKRYKWLGPADAAQSGHASLALLKFPAKGDMESTAHFLMNDRMTKDGKILKIERKIIKGGDVIMITGLSTSIGALSRPRTSGPLTKRKDAACLIGTKDSYLWIVYSAVESDFIRFMPVFERALETLSFER